MQAPSSHAADASHAESLADALLRQADAIGAMADAVAKARTVLEYQNDRRKMALAIAFKEARLMGATSATEAEHYARASDSYAATMQALEVQSYECERITQKHGAAQAKFDALRSLVSLEKSKIGIL